MNSDGSTAAPTAVSEEIGALDQLLDQVRSLKSRARIVELCEMAVRFRRLAPYNVMLIYMQRPDARHVMGATAWREMGRSPKENAHPLVILRPFGPVDFLFDVADTDGKDGPDQLTLGNLGENAFGADGALSHETLSRFIHGCAKCCISVAERKEHLMKAGHARRADGDSFAIELNVDHRSAQKFCTLCHELAHIFCGHLGPVKGWVEARPPINDAQCETEAELSAFLAARRFGVTPNSATYLDWYSNPHGKMPEFSLETVLVAVGKIEALLRGELRKRKNR